jgi:hypothetical protein
VKRRVVVSLFLAISMTACSSWERTTFQTLSASKAVLDTAQADYTSRTIPQTHCAYDIINDGKAAQTAAVDAMVVYEQLKATKGSLTAQEAIVTADLVALAPMVVQIQALIANPTTTCNAAADQNAIQNDATKGVKQ